MTRPNLFSFATSELSQDALLCWLSALALHDDVDLQHLGRSFIAWLWGRAKRTSVAPDQVRLLTNPERQVNHIDVIFEAEMRHSVASLVAKCVGEHGVGRILPSTRRTGAQRASSRAWWSTKACAARGRFSCQSTPALPSAPSVTNFTQPSWVPSRWQTLASA